VGVTDLDPLRLTARQARRMLVEGEVSAAELMKVYLDQIEVTKARNTESNLCGVKLTDLTEHYKAARTRLDSLLASIAPPEAAEDRRAYEAIRRAWQNEPVHETAERQSPLASLTQQVYRRFGEAAQRIEFEGKVLDRLTILGLLSRTGDDQSADLIVPSNFLDSTSEILKRRSIQRVQDVGNPWLDAGIVSYSTLDYRHDREYWKEWFPAKLITECFLDSSGTGFTRCWR
jgi:hypothetical protein